MLWRLGPSTVRGVHTELAKKEPVTYTTVLKLMQIMTEKGLVKRDETGTRAFVSAGFEAGRYTAPDYPGCPRSCVWRVGCTTGNASAVGEAYFGGGDRCNRQMLDEAEKRGKR